MDKLQEVTDLKAKLEKNQANYEKLIQTAREQLGAASAKKALDLPSVVTVADAQQQLDKLITRKETESLQLAALPEIIQQLQPGSSDTANARGPDRHKLIADAQATYNKLMGQLTLKAHRTTDPAVTPEVLGAMHDLYEAGVTLRNTARVADTIECWGIEVKRNVMGEMIGFADEEAHYGDWNPVKAETKPPWTPPVFASYSKRLKLSEKRLLQLFIGYQKSRTDNVVTGWNTQTRDEFNQFQDHLEDSDAIPEPSFKPPSQDDLCAELKMSEKSLRNRFKSFKAENGIPNSYRHLTSANYQAFRVFLDGTPVAKYGGGIVR